MAGITRRGWCCRKGGTGSVSAVVRRTVVHIAGAIIYGAHAGAGSLKANGGFGGNRTLGVNDYRWRTGQLHLHNTPGTGIGADAWRYSQSSDQPYRFEFW